MKFDFQTLGLLPVRFKMIWHPFCYHDGGHDNQYRQGTQKSQRGDGFYQFHSAMFTIGCEILNRKLFDQFFCSLASVLETMKMFRWQALGFKSIRKQQGSSRTTETIWN
jgi:hypothetical protein